MARPSVLSSLLALAPALAAAHQEPGAAAPDAVAPDIVLVVWDAACVAPDRSLEDALAAWPALGGLLAGGRVLPRAHLPVPRGPDSWEVLATGLYPHQTGRRLDPSASLVQRLVEGGYAAFCAGRFPDRRLAAHGFSNAEPADVLTPEGRASLDAFVAAQDRDRPIFVWWAPQVSGGARDELASGAELDGALADLVAALRDRGRSDRTLWAFLDDGAEHGILGRESAREERRRATLAFVLPGRIEPGTAEDVLATSLDVHPTLLDFAGVTVPGELVGSSLRPWLEGRGEPRTERVYGELYVGAGAGQGGRRDPRREPALLYVRTERWKYVAQLIDLELPVDGDKLAYPISAGEELLFDLASDPAETQDLAGDPRHAEELLALRADVLGWWSRTGGRELPEPTWFTGPPPPRSGEDGRPNIVLIISDDQDWEHLGFMGNDLVHTPNLDRLAEEGVVFPTAHVTMSRCRPSLASLLTGLYPHQNGIHANKTARTLRRADSLPDLLKRAGYATYMGGKFWEGNHHSMGFVEPELQDRNHFVRDGQAELTAFVEEHAGKRPFFVWWAPLLPHGPFNPPQRYLDLFDRERIPLPDHLVGDPGEFRESELLSLAMEAWLDDGLGTLLGELDELGQRENTLFAFLIDNGWAYGYPSKGSVFEKGLRTPVFFTWGRGIQGGRRLDALVSEVDLYATLLDYAGIPVPAGRDARSLRPLIEGRPGEPREALYGACYRNLERVGRSRVENDVYALYARTAEWKYVLYLRDVGADASEVYAHFADFPARERGDEDLFHLTEDPHELSDVAGDPAHAELVRALRADVLAWWKATGGPELELP